jgi:hypothetical protein
MSSFGQNVAIGLLTVTAAFGCSSKKPPSFSNPADNAEYTLTDHPGWFGGNPKIFKAKMGSIRQALADDDSTVKVTASDGQNDHKVDRSALQVVVNNLAPGNGAPAIAADQSQAIMQGFEACAKLVQAGMAPFKPAVNDPAFPTYMSAVNTLSQNCLTAANTPGLDVPLFNVCVKFQSGMLSASSTDNKIFTPVVIDDDAPKRAKSTATKSVTEQSTSMTQMISTCSNGKAQGTTWAGPGTTATPPTAKLPGSSAPVSGPQMEAPPKVKEAKKDAKGPKLKTK